MLCILECLFAVTEHIVDVSTEKYWCKQTVISSNLLIATYLLSVAVDIVLLLLLVILLCCDVHIVNNF